MPSTVNLYQIGVWFCVGLFTGAGWAIAALLVGRDLILILDPLRAAPRHVGTIAFASHHAFF